MSSQQAVDNWLFLHRSDKERIRELEEQLAEIQPRIGKEKTDNEQLRERIARAKAILESSDGMTQKMKDALAVLEGK